MSTKPTHKEPVAVGTWTFPLEAHVPCSVDECRAQAVILPVHRQSAEGVENLVAKVRTAVANRARINPGLVAARLPTLDLWGAAGLKLLKDSCPLEPGQAVSEEQVNGAGGGV